MIDLNDLLVKAGLDPKQTMIMRHRPAEAPLRKLLPWLAAERHDLYNAYQSTHDPRVEKALAKASHLVSLIGHQAGKAIFVGVYGLKDWKEISNQEYWAMLEHRELRELGMVGSTSGRRLRLFRLALGDQLAAWKGRLVVGWPPPERSWWRWAARNQMPVAAVHDENQLVSRMPPWHELILEWSVLSSLPASWAAAMSQWRGVYLILDRSCGKGYVGSAYGGDNILGRWRGYGSSGHGGNVGLKGRDPVHFRFAVLQLVAPDTSRDEVIWLEASWKERLGTREFGLNKN